MLPRFLFGILFLTSVFAADLTVESAQLHDYEDGPPVASGSKFRPGEKVFLTFQIGGFQSTEDDHIQLAYEITATDPDQKPLAPVKSGTIEAELAPEDKKKGSQWMPKIRYEVQVPETPVAGTCHLQIQVADKISGARATKDVPFTVPSAAVEPSDTLAIKNFQFLRSESEKDKLPEGGAYRPGDAVWVRFDITGYKFGPKYRYHVKYGLALLDSTGKSMFSNPNAAEDTNESFYPRMYLPAKFSLNLDKNIRAGEYKLVVSLGDPVGQQTFEGIRVFRVE
jgi:hypothetical protein